MKPIRASQIPPIGVAGRQNSEADGDEQVGEPWPRRAATRVARLRSPVPLQAIARAIRPPSSGKAGIRLKTRTSRLMLRARRSRRAIPEVSVSPWSADRLLEVVPPAGSDPDRDAGDADRQR